MEEGKGLQKIRTFSSDVKRARGGNTPVLQKEPPQTATTPTQPPAPVVRIISDQKVDPKPLAAEGEIITDQKKVEKQEKTQVSQPVPEANPQPKVVPHSVETDLLNTTKAVETKLPTTPISTHSLEKDPYALPKAPMLDPNSLSVLDTGTELDEGSIITDRKRDRFKLLPAIWESLQNWFQEEKSDIEERAEKRRAAIPKVRSVQERKEVLAKAATSSMLATREEKLQLPKQPATSKKSEKKKDAPIVIKKKSEVPKPSWSHYEGEQPEVIEEKSAEEVKPEPVPTPAPSAETPVAISMTAPTLVEEEKIAAPVAAEVTKEEPVVEPVVVKEVTEAKEPKREPAPEPRKFAAPTARSVRTGGLPVWSYAVVGVLATGLGIGLTWWAFNSEVNLPVNSGGNVSEVEPTSTVIENPVALGSSRSEFFSNLMEAVTPGTAVTYITPTRSIASATSPASKEQILSTLNWQISNSFAGAIERIEFGKHDSTTPFIVLHTTSFDDAFGGILNWEKNMSTDLRPLFGEAVTGTFVDETVVNHDVRVLRDTNRNVVLMYGLINRNTIVITGDQNAFTVVAESIR